jgi:CRP/FNR family transcriptional regulator, cyclic AMP receptor protein
MASGGSQHSSVEMLIELHRGDREFRHAISTRTFHAGQAVAEPDVLLRNMLILIEGRVQLIHEGRNGRRLGLATLSPGTVIWEGYLLDERGPSMKAHALTDCIVWMAPSPQARELLLRYAALRWGMLQTVGERMVQVENRMEEVAFQRLRERLAHLLLDLSSGKRFVAAISQQTLADMLGTYRETISGILRDFKAIGLVELGYRKIELRDVSGLRAAAGSLSYYRPAARIQ